MTDIISSPALPLVAELEASGFEWRLVDDRVQVRPVAALTADLRARLRERYPQVVELMRTIDGGVRARREQFSVEWQRRLADTSPRFLFRGDVPYVFAVCFSCGEPNGEKWGRCWRCALAWRLAIGAHIPTVIDEAKIVA